MSNSKKVTESKVTGKAVGVRGKTIVASQTTPEQVGPVESAIADPVDPPVPEPEAIESETEPTEATAALLEAAVPGNTPEKAPVRRDPRLPEVGTPIIRKWRGHVVTVRETDDGVFKVKVDSAYVGEARSLTKAAEMALATEGITSGVNGFSWFHVGVEAKSKYAASDRRIASLTALIARIDERIQVSEDRVQRLMADRSNALRDLEKVRTTVTAETATASTED